MFVINYIMALSKYIKPIITSTPSTIIQVSLLSSLISQDYKYVMFVGGFILTEVSNKGIKKIFNSARPNSSGGILGGMPYGCSWYPSGKESTSPGMPSGHSQGLCFSATFWSLYVLGKFKKNKMSIGCAVILTLLALGVMIQRVHSGCHSIMQVLVGCVLGVASGYGYYKLCNKLNPKKFPPLTG
jgi:membrane-associated phospholipid phosphatase